MRIAILGVALALAACGDTDEPAREPAAAESPPPPAAEPSAMLEELGEVDLAQADLEGELACSFRSSEGGGTLFLGRGDVLDEAGAAAVVKYGGEVVRLAMAGTGGYDAMADGARFEGDGLTLMVTPGEGGPLPEDPQVAMESPIHPATLTLAPADGPEQTIEGLYECGP